MRTPSAVITVNGKAVASTFNERLISVSITDKAGTSSDSISCELNDGNPFVTIPQKGDTITAALGYVETGTVYFGEYTADNPEVNCLPYTLTVNGKGANMRDALKERKSRHWDGKTVKVIVTEIAGDHGLTPAIDDDVSGYTYEWFGQQDEADIEVLNRLADRHGALLSVKAGRLVFAKKGSGATATGKDMPTITATPYNILTGTCRTTFELRERFKKVKARHQNRRTAEIDEVEEDSDDDGTATMTLPEPYADEGEARKAARSKAADLKRKTITTNVTLFGDPTIRAGCPLVYSGVRPELDGIEFTIETATHNISKSGYTVDVEAVLKVAAASSSTSSSTSDDDGDTDEYVPSPSTSGGIGHA